MEGGVEGGEDDAGEGCDFGLGGGGVRGGDGLLGAGERVAWCGLRGTGERGGLREFVVLRLVVLVLLFLRDEVCVAGEGAAEGVVGGGRR